MLWFSEHRALCLRALCSVSQSTVVCVSEHFAQCLRAPWSVSQSTVLSVSEHRALCLRALCSVSQSTVVCVSEHCAQCLRALCSVSQSTVLWFWRMYHSDETRFSILVYWCRFLLHWTKLQNKQTYKHVFHELSLQSQPLQVVYKP